MREVMKQDLKFNDYPFMNPYEYNNGCGNVMMFVIIVLAALVMSGCRTMKKTTHSSASDVSKTDSVVIRTEYREVIDTTYITIEREAESVMVRDTVSLLENSYAKSRAEIRSDGLLYHSLETKPQNKPVPTKTITIVKDSIVYRDRFVYAEETTNEKTTKTHQSEFIVAILVALIAVLYACRKYFLKFIIYIMKK
jgi:hypothetical protein